MARIAAFSKGLEVGSKQKFVFEREKPVFSDLRNEHIFEFKAICVNLARKVGLTEGQMGHVITDRQGGGRKVTYMNFFGVNPIRVKRSGVNRFIKEYGIMLTPDEIKQFHIAFNVYERERAQAKTNSEGWSKFGAKFRARSHRADDDTND